MTILSHTLKLTLWIRGWGFDFEVLSPESLRRQIAEDKRRAGKVYMAGCRQAGEHAALSFSPRRFSPVLTYLPSDLPDRLPVEKIAALFCVIPLAEFILPDETKGVGDAEMLAEELKSSLPNLGKRKHFGACHRFLSLRAFQARGVQLNFHGRPEEMRIFNATPSTTRNRETA
jgi:hypothetical protein